MDFHNIKNRKRPESVPGHCLCRLGQATHE